MTTCHHRTRQIVAMEYDKLSLPITTRIHTRLQHKITPPTPQMRGVSDSHENFEFEEIWQAYTNAPDGLMARKTGKQKALKIFKRYKLSSKHQLILQAIYNYWRNDANWRKGFQPTLARFLDEEIYLEEPQVPMIKPISTRQTYDVFTEQD